jgi:CRISPR-associated protein Cas5h
MELIVFDIAGEIAHFRRPDTMGTQATYPFITRTSLCGLMASILGLEMMPQGTRCGIQLISTVQTVAQEMSLHGKSWISGGDQSSYNRPTALELVVRPNYRIYYAGPMIDELNGRLRKGQSHYHTYLGSAFCLTFPKWVDALRDVEPAEIESDEPLSCLTVVPSAAVKRLLVDEENEYARVGGVFRNYLGSRRFQGSLSLLYNVNGGKIRFLPNVVNADDFWQFYYLPDKTVICLW